MSKRVELRWVSDERARSEELRAGGCWARVCRGESELIRDGTRREVLYWSAGVGHSGALLSGTEHKRSKAYARAVRGLLRCVKLAEAEERMERAEDAPPLLPPEFGGDQPVATTEDGSRLLFCSGAAAEVRPFVFKGEHGRGVRGPGPDELAVMAWVLDAAGNVARLKLEPHEARVLAADLVKRAAVVERERKL